MLSKNNILHDFGIINKIELKRSVLIAREHGEKIVMTNGIFDILHIGHVTYLTHAKKFGDRLIVGVNSDMSTKRLKGLNRPINSLMHRMIVLSALRVIDWVISFNDDTPNKLISEILPDVLVKGGDYNLSEIAGSQAVLANGGDVKTLDFKEGFSTTNIINIISNIKNI